MLERARRDFADPRVQACIIQPRSPIEVPCRVCKATVDEPCRGRLGSFCPDEKQHATYRPSYREGVFSAIETCAVAHGWEFPCPACGASFMEPCFEFRECTTCHQGKMRVHADHEIRRRMLNAKLHALGLEGVGESGYCSSEAWHKFSWIAEAQRIATGRFDVYSNDELLMRLVEAQKRGEGVVALAEELWPQVKARSEAREAQYARLRAQEDEKHAKSKEKSPAPLGASWVPREPPPPPEEEAPKKGQASLAAFGG